jgi:lauroyl/myristoyl acyltransferase
MGGHRTWLASGTAALARDAGVAVLPGFTVREGFEQVGYFLEPIEPGDFDGPAELHARLAEVVGNWIMAHLPQYYPQRFPAAPRPARDPVEAAAEGAPGLEPE